MKIHKRIEREIRATVASGEGLDAELSRELLTAYDRARAHVPMTTKDCRDAGVTSAHAGAWMEARLECVLSTEGWHGWLWGNTALPQYDLTELVASLACYAGISKWALLDEMAALEIPALEIPA